MFLQRLLNALASNLQIKWFTVLLSQRAYGICHDAHALSAKSKAGRPIVIGCREEGMARRDAGQRRETEVAEALRRFLRQSLHHPGAAHSSFHTRSAFVRGKLHRHVV